MAKQSSAPHSQPPSEADLDLKRELLRVVLAKTLKNGVPPQWIGAELNTMALPSGEPWIELRLSVQVDEPRLIAFISSFQADFERRLLEIAPDAKKWVAGIVWTVTPDPIFEVAMPSPDYWEHVIADRALTARQKGAMGWDRDTMARHFSETSPGDLMVDFDDTNPPERGVEDISPPPRR